MIKAEIARSNKPDNPSRHPAMTLRLQRRQIPKKKRDNPRIAIIRIRILNVILP